MPATVTKEIDTGLSIYEINKNLMKEEKPLDPIAINIAITPYFFFIFFILSYSIEHFMYSTIV